MEATGAKQRPWRTQVSVSFSRAIDRRLDTLLVQSMGACFIAIAAAHFVEGVSILSSRNPFVLNPIGRNAMEESATAYHDAKSAGTAMRCKQC